MASLCDFGNPRGCCHADSPLTYLWLVPAIVLTVPCWCPTAPFYLVYQCIKRDCDGYQDKYEVVDGDAVMGGAAPCDEGAPAV